MTEPLPENQETLLVIRAPLSGDGFVSKRRWKDDEFVRVVAPKTAHRVDEQSVCQG